MGGLAVESGELDLEAILSLENWLLLFKHVSDMALVLMDWQGEDAGKGISVCAGCFGA